MKPFQQIRYVANKIKKGARPITFTYKKENGEVSQRNIMVNIDIIKAMEKRGTPVTGEGNWHSGRSEGRNGFTIRLGRELYIRGIEPASNKLKIFKCSGISNLS